MGSYKYTKYANRIPVVEKYVDNQYVSVVNTGVYNEDIKKYNYFVLDPDNNQNTSYILRVYEPVKKYQVFCCGAGGHGGVIYGSGGNGGNYIYIDNTNADDSKTLAIGSYLIKPGIATNIINHNNNSIKKTIDGIKSNGSFYLIKYQNSSFGNYKNLANINDYKLKDWSPATLNTSGEIISISKINGVKTTKIESDKVYEFIFYLSKTKTFKFTNFTNTYYTRVIKISNNDNINVLYTPDSNNNYSYIAGRDFDVIITILLYQNSNVVTDEQKPSWSSIFNVDYANSISNDFYVYNFMQKDTINNIGSGIRIQHSETTNITYNSNPDADYTFLNDIANNSSVTENKYGPAGGNPGTICIISNNPGVNIAYMLKRFYMPFLFAAQLNLSGGNPGSTVNGTNSVLNILKGVGGTNRNLTRTSGRNISINQNTKEWFSGVKGYFTNYFKIFAYYPYDPNIEMNNTSLANGGYTGYWQFIKDEINYNYGANGVNDLTSPNYGTFGCGGQGGSILLDQNGDNKNSNFTGSKGKNGVFILSFLNQALATISNDNSMVLRKMFGLFGITNDKLEYINELKETNIEAPNIDFKGMINNLFIHQGNIHIDQTYITELYTYIPKANLEILIAVIYLIKSIYSVIAKNINLINIAKITTLNINIIDDLTKERIEWSDNSVILRIYVCDVIDNSYINKYLSGSVVTTTKCRSILSLNDTITIIKEPNGEIKEFLNSVSNILISNVYDSTINSDAYLFIKNTISYIFDIEPKNFKIHIYAIKTAYEVLFYNSIIYAIIYHSKTITITYTETIIENIYTQLNKCNIDLKIITDRITEYKNIFQEQNEFKLYFNNSINDYNNYRDKNTSFHNLLASKKAYTSTKEKFRDTVNIFTLIIFIIVVIIIIWLIYVMFFNSNKYDAMPHLIFMFLILIIIVFIMNYVNYSYGYKEFFDNPSQLEIYDNENYYINNVTYNNNDYQVTYITSTSSFILNKNAETSIVLINNGTSASSAVNQGIGGTINLYDPDYISSNIKENKQYSIGFNESSITITNTTDATNSITTKQRSSDNINKIKLFYNNTGNNYSSNYETLLDYYNDKINSNNPYTSNTLTSNEIYTNAALSGLIYIFNSSNINEDANSYTNVISTDVLNNKRINEIINVLFYTNKSNDKSAYYYGTSGGITDIDKTNYPNAYGLGGTYGNSGNSGNNGACIIINKQVDFSPTHMDVQTLINKYNNNLNKYIYDRFNQIYLIDNNVIYNNALVSFRKRYDEENVKNNKYKKYETNLNQYSMNILTDVYFRFELAKILIYIFLALIICIIIHLFNNKHFIFMLVVFILLVIFIVLYFFYNMNINTRRDYYKYYWSKYNNDN